VASDRKRLDQVLQHIRRIKTSDYPIIQGNGFDGGYRIGERPWRDLPEASKLAILQDAVDWSGITNRDQATILLSEIDPGRITDGQRTRLIDAATVQPSYHELLSESASRGGGQDKDRRMER